MFEPKKIKIATQNLWGFKDWDVRLPKLVSLIQKEYPDVLFVQEAQSEKKVGGRNQMNDIWEQVKYPYSHYSPVSVKTKKGGVALPVALDHGLGVFSKYPIENISVVSLTRDPEDKEDRAVVFFSVRIDTVVHEFVNIHFSNSDKWAKQHFLELLSILRSTKKNPILVGDFNLYSLSKDNFNYGDLYVNSFEVKKYISYPNDNDTLDYILVPLDYVFSTIECLDEPVSDHRMLIAEISKK